MEDAEFSDEFCQFIQGVVPAIEAAELLLLVADRPDVWWNVADALGKLRPGVTIADADAARYLSAFEAAGVLERRADGAIRFRPSTAALAAHVRTLAQAYEERPVTLVRVVYAMRDAKIRTFADAFRLRKK